ncbi:peptidylprolyl isomerase [Sphingomonas aerophila]|nr:peptidylprolyl isomerase [Sphingomonas aerophila]
MFAALLVSLAVQAASATVPPSPSDPIEADWRTIPDDELLVMTLSGNRTVVIRLATPYAPEHVANVRRLALAHWWDGTSVYRVQDNWVTQWGDETEKKPLPMGIAARPAAEYDIAAGFRAAQRMTVSDAYSGVSGITADGWAVAGSKPGVGPVADASPGWLAHCYGTVGVARDASPDTGTGSELFMPIGGSARRLDRNYTIVGRVIEGASLLSGLPRSDAPMGMYATAAERLPITSVRLASDMPAAGRPRYQYRAADNPRFAALIATRENPKPPTIGLGGADVCDVPIATRRAP